MKNLWVIFSCTKPHHTTRSLYKWVIPPAATEVAQKWQNAFFSFLKACTNVHVQPDTTNENKLSTSTWTMEDVCKYIGAIEIQHMDHLEEFCTLKEVQEKGKFVKTLCELKKHFLLDIEIYLCQLKNYCCHTLTSSHQAMKHWHTCSKQKKPSPS